VTALEPKRTTRKPLGSPTLPSRGPATVDDFEVLQNGVPVVLTDATFIARQVRQASASSPQSDVTFAPLVFLIDDMAMTPAGFQRVRNGLRAFVERELSAGVEVGILRTGEPGSRRESS